VCSSDLLLATGVAREQRTRAVTSPLTGNMFWPFPPMEKRSPANGIAITEIRDLRHM
jgi:hypothetical protein